MDESRAAKGPAALGVLALQQMALPGAGPKHFPASGNLEALCRGFFGFNAFWTSHKSITRLSFKKSAQYKERNGWKQGKSSKNSGFYISSVKRGQSNQEGR